jgi:hypothetical protein
MRWRDEGGRKSLDFKKKVVFGGGERGGGARRV